MNLQELKNIELQTLNLHEMRDITAEIIDNKTKKLRGDLEELLLQKELLERNLEKKSNELQEL